MKITVAKVSQVIGLVLILTLTGYANFSAIDKSISQVTPRGAEQMVNDRSTDLLVLVAFSGGGISPESDLFLAGSNATLWEKQPETYRIIVAGVIDPDWLDRLGGLCIESRTGDDPNEPITVLEGLIKDQAQLSEIQNTLYGLHYKLLSVEILQG